MNLTNTLFKQVDNSSLVVFRILFGLLITLEAWGAIATGWVRITLVEPDFTFNFIGFDFLQYLQGEFMYFYFFLMGLFGVFVMLGYRYRLSIFIYTLLWTMAYLMQKSSYNNHYYLLILLCVFMLISPAHKYFSLDAKRNPSIQSISMPQWVPWFLILQIWIVYTYASIAKFYPDWLDLTFPKLLMAGKQSTPIIGDFLQTHLAHVSIKYVGILFDLLVIPLLLWKRTRLFIFIFSIFFHLFNSYVFHIGIFPYMSLAFSLFFFPPALINRLFLKRKPFYAGNEVKVPNYKPILMPFAVSWFFVQIALPVRHHFIDDDVLWTEEGHRLSWRMMLRSKHGVTSMRVVDKNTGEEKWINNSDYIKNKQYKTIVKPDGAWQYAQVIKEDFKQKGKDVEVFAHVKISVNGRPYKKLIDDQVDLASVKWNYFGHNSWILPRPLNFYKKNK